MPGFRSQAALDSAAVGGVFRFYLALHWEKPLHYVDLVLQLSGSSFPFVMVTYKAK